MFESFFYVFPAFKPATFLTRIFSLWEYLLYLETALLTVGERRAYPTWRPEDGSAYETQTINLF